MSEMEEFNATPFTRNRPFVAPQTQTKALEEEISETLEQLPVLREVVTHLDEKIASTDSIKQAMVVAKQYELTTEQALIVLNIVNQQLASERSYIRARVERVKR